MKILVYGAGNIGRLYAARLAQAGADVTLLARGQRLRILRERGLVLQDVDGRRTTTTVGLVDRLNADDAYDLVLVVLPKHRIAEVLPMLAENEHTPNVMFFGNNAEGFSKLTAALGDSRVLAGFPGAAAIDEGDALRYVICSKREQPTTIGELDGHRSERLDAIAAAFEEAGFPVAISDDMDAWLKTHVAEVLPTVCAIYGANGDPEQLASSPDALHEMVDAIREGYQVLRKLGVSITPKNRRLFEWLPIRPLMFIMRQSLRSKDTAIKLGHAEGARNEWQRLADEFSRLIDEAKIPTPSFAALVRNLRPAEHPPNDSNKTLTQTIDALLRREGVPGCSIGVVDAGATRIETFGYADLERRVPVISSTRFHLFSATKLYTAAALMLLVERGQIDLDDSIEDHLPELELRTPITVRQLASHASGLPDTLRAFLAVHLPGEPVPTASQALARYRLGRGRVAGRRAHYRNVNYAVLGRLIECVSDSSYEAFVRREILEPLRADLDFGPRQDGTEAVGYDSRFSPMHVAMRIGFRDTAKRVFARRHNGLTATRPYAIDTASIGGLVGSGSDFLPFLREMLSTEDGLLRATSKREMLTVHSRGAAGIVSKDGVGIGFKRGGRFWNHEGGGAGFCTETRIYPDEGIGIVILMNRTHSGHLSKVCHRVCEAIVADRPFRDTPLEEASRR